MAENEEILVEKICEGGFGSEANIIVELRTVFPGIGGIIKTSQTLVCALREPKEKQLFPRLDFSHRLFLKHALIKKLDDYFHRIKKYEFTHIPRPIGSICKTNGKNYDACLYEWVFGRDGFPWEYSNGQDNIPVMLGEWNECVGAFYSAGIDIAKDCVDSENGKLSQNIVHQLYKVDCNLWNKLNCLWQRIDFGTNSIRIDYENLARFLHDNKNNLKGILGYNRYKMMIFIHRYFIAKEKMSQEEIEDLEDLIKCFRLSSLRHLSSKHINDADIDIKIDPCESSLDLI